MPGDRVGVILEAETKFAHLYQFVLGQNSWDEQPAAHVEDILLLLGQVNDRQTVCVGGGKILRAHIQLLAQAMGENVGGVQGSTIFC